MNVLLLVIGILLLWVGGELLIRGATALARLWGLSPLVIGLTVVAFGTSAPELAATLAATLRDSPAIAFGNIVGSNIANLGLILGLTALLQPLTTHARFLWREVPFMLAVSLLMTLLMLDGRAGRIEGLLLLALIVGYLFYLLRTGAEPPEVIAEFREEYGDHGVRPWKAVAGTAAGIVVLVVGADVLVRGAVGIAEALGLATGIVSTAPSPCSATRRSLPAWAWSSGSMASSTWRWRASLSAAGYWPPWACSDQASPP